jgi:uncharacterized protein (TIGR02246 family)
MEETPMPTTMPETEQIKSLHTALLDAWNRRDARAMSELFAESGSMVGFDGSQANTPAEIFAHLDPIFRDHPTARFIAKVREVRMIGETATLLRAVAGMIPPGQSKVKPEVNAVQSLVASKRDGQWRIELFQNTPAAWHGRPQDVENLTAELQALV